jgi:2-iminobutanoate/2-iminopropanoate deaminase
MRTGTGCGSAAQPRQQRQPEAVRTEPSNGQGDDRRRRPAHARLHALPALGESFQSGLKQVIASTEAPRAIGPYSPAVRAGDLLFISGQIPIDPATGSLVEGDISAQTRRVLDNVNALLSGAGLAFDDVVRTTIFLADLSDFGAVNDVYGTYFREPYPARATVEVAKLPKNARVEIDAIASYR